MKYIAGICLLLACLTIPAGARAAPGDLDESFDRDGLVVGNVVDGAVADMGIAGDGSIVVASTDLSGEITRFSPDGGSASGPIGAGLGAGQSAVAAIDLRPDGRIVVGGSGGASHPNDFAVSELGSDGSLRCGGAGLCFVETDFAGGVDRLRDIAALPDGATVAAGTVTGPAGNQLGVARYLPDGTLDSMFAVDGKLILETGGASSFAKNAVVAVLPDGSILLAGAGPGPDGSGRGDLLLAKLEPDGDLDPSFGGGDGFATVDIDGRDDAASIAVGPDGGIVVGIDACAVGLTTDCQPALARFTSTGELDSGFGSGGVVWPAAGAKVVVTPDGPLFTGGSTRLREFFQLDFALGRYASDGTPDASFSGDGVATADFGLGQDRAIALAVTADGRPVLAGTTFSDVTRLALARFETAAGPPDADADGVLDPGDRCPERFALGGCPQVERELTVKRVRGGRLKAKLASDLDACRARQPLKVQVRKDGRWVTIAREKTTPNGSLVSEGRPLGGKYRATAKATLEPPLGRCEKVRSKAVIIN
jgi:uncharacterized delta-60 repeat protein